MSPVTTHKIEPELQGPTPRPVREAPALPRLQGRLTKSAVFLFCLVCWFASYRLREEKDWLRHQQAVNGQVLNRWSTAHSDAAEYHLQFSFSSSRGLVRDEMSVDEDTFYHYDRGDKIALVYRRDAPAQWRLTPASLGSVRALQSNSICGIIIGTATALVGWCCLWTHREKRLRFLRDGKAVVATVTKSSAVADFLPYPMLTYEWRTGGGQSRHKTIVVTNDVQKRYPAGTQFTALCDPCDTYIGVPYFLATEGEVKGKYDGPQLLTIP